MRVLFIISELTLGGAQKQVVELARELVRVGHDAAIYTLNDDVPRAKELEGSGVELIVDQKRWKLDPAVIARLRRFIARWRPDILHGFLYDGDIYARLAAAGTGIPVLNSERSDNYTISKVQKAAHLATRFLVDGVVANSRSGAAFAERLYGYDPAHMHVVWNGLRADEFAKKAASTESYRETFFGPGAHKLAVMVGAIKPAKDYPLALDTAAALVRSAPEWRVLFLGDQLVKRVDYGVGKDSDSGDYKAMVMRHFERLDLDREVKLGKIRFAGERRDAPAIVAQADVFFITSCREGFPNVVLEAMALGVPVVSTDYSDIRHILPRASQVVARAPEALAAAIVAAERERDAIAQEQKRWLRAHATIEQAALNLENVYQRYVRPDSLAHA
jgi:glycosyltransferase involved in cell wall biosynthesis